MNTFKQECIKLIKRDSKDLYCHKKHAFQINAVLLNVLFINEAWFFFIKVSTKILNRTTDFNIDNKKCLWYTRSAY